MGIIILLVLTAAEIFFMVWNLKTKRNHAAEKSVADIAEAVIFAVLSFTGILMWGFRYYTIAAFLTVFAISGMITLIRRKEKKYKKCSTISKTVWKIVIFCLAVFPAVLFPQYKLIEPTGESNVAEKTYVFTDTSRKEEFSDQDINRNITVEVYYPEDLAGKCPLVVFSHGAFGFYGSNESTFTELASNGYIVASINHPYHALFDTEAYGRLVTFDQEIVQKSREFENQDMSDEEFKLSHRWLKLRVDDMNFVIDTLKNEASEGTDDILSMIDTTKTGVFGHSLGGAASAQIGRERADIDAVIVVDGTIIGDELEYKDNKIICSTQPYPVYILDIFGENHYNEAQQYADMYPNLVLSEYSDKVRNIVFRGAGHLNMTDLSMFSPMLAKFLGTGDVNSRECLTSMNGVIREFFDWRLKDAAEPDFKEEY
ncbi:MAG: hypothetical protein Q4F95_08245 [Oscillospiraceae bacterium]|nr:hypothetical protein [Oscillospiraceae bacterium]